VCEAKCVDYFPYCNHETIQKQNEVAFVCLQTSNYMDKFNNLDLTVPDCRNMIFVQFRSDKAEVKPADNTQFFVSFF